MRKSAILLVIVAICAMPMTASAITINFDNIGSASLYILAPPQPGLPIGAPPLCGLVDGFYFGSVGQAGGFSRVDVLDLNNAFPSLGTAYSGNYSLLNNVYGDAVVTEKDGNTFSFQGVYAAAHGNNTGQRSVVGYLNDVEVGSISLNLTNDWQEVTGSLSNIDKLVFKLTSDVTYGLFFLDNIVLNESTSVPEPGTMLLFGAGLAGLGIMRKRIKA